MNNNTQGLRLRGLAALCLALGYASTADAESITIVGQPTFFSESRVEENRGSTRPPAVGFISSSSYNGRGSSGTISSIDGPFIPSPVVFDPTEAKGESSNTQLKSLSRASGDILFRNDRNDPFPFVLARNTSVTTRYFSFSSVDPTVPLDFISFLTGELTTFRGIAESLRDVYASMSFGLQIIDTNNQVLADVFQVSAVNRRQFSSSFFLSTLATGAADLTDWQSAIDGTLDTTGGTLDISYLRRFENAFNAPVDTILGFQWTLQTEAFMEGAGVSGQFESDFFTTADFGLEINSSAAGVATMTEVLSVPAMIPEPSSLLLSALGVIGVVGLIARRKAC